MPSGKPINFKLIVTLAAVIILSIFSYTKFINSKPNTAPNEEEKSKESSNLNLPEDLPTPPDSKELSFKKGSNNLQTTLQTTQKPEDIYNFYKNILLNKRWVIKGDVEDENGYITKYRKDSNNLTVTITKDNTLNVTIVGIELESD